MKDEEGFDREILSDVQAERTHLKAELLRASNELAELRKQVVDAAEDLEEGHEATALARLHRALASPPSPAPVESEPKECEACGSTNDEHNADDHRDWNATWASPAADTAKPSPEASK